MSKKLGSLIYLSSLVDVKSLQSALVCLTVFSVSVKHKDCVSPVPRHAAHVITVFISKQVLTFRQLYTLKYTRVTEEEVYNRGQSRHW